MSQPASQIEYARHAGRTGQIPQAAMAETVAAARFQDLTARLASQVGEITGIDEFCGAGGLSQGAAAVPGVAMKMGANHKEICIQSWAANFRDADTYCGDVRSIDVARFPRYDLHLASPICPPFSNSRGVRRDFDRDTQGVLWETAEDAATTEAKRGRLLMHEVPRYLDAMALRGEPVLAGVTENVPQARKWASWHTWLQRIRDAGPGYDVTVIALNSMHARPVRTRWAPQSRDRLYVAYCLKLFGRTPDWDKWLRPLAWCTACDEQVTAMQVWKKPGTDMGTYGRNGQYWYRCPRRSCRNEIVDPAVLPIAAVIDWSDPGRPVGDRGRPAPVVPATRQRIEAGIRRHARPFVLEAGGNTYERRPGVRTRPVDMPVTTQTTTASKALAVPSLVIPEGMHGGGVTLPPFIAVLRNNSASRGVDEPVSTVSTTGAHHGLVVPAREVAWACEHLLVPYYQNGRARPANWPVGTLSTKDRYGIALIGDLPVDIDEVLYRMLKPEEIAAAMAFSVDYVVCGNSKERVMQLGNAVTPPAGEVIVSALVEVITGVELPRELALAA